MYISQKLRVAKYLGMSHVSVTVYQSGELILGANVVLWGIILMLHAVGTSFGAFFTLRVLLGR